MKPTKKLHELGQSLWLDNITRDLLTTGTLNHYIDELSVTGLTSNPTIFDHAIKNSNAYDGAIRSKQNAQKSSEELFFELALEDITKAADLFRPIWERTNGVDGWVSLEVSPLLAHDTRNTMAAVAYLHSQGARPNLFIKIPGTPEGLPAIEGAIVAGVPVNVTLLFSREHYLAAAEAFLRGIDRRLDAGLNPNVGSVASVFVSRWDTAVMGRVPEPLHNRLGIAMAGRVYKAYRDLLDSPRWQRAFNFGARPQRLLWASTGTKDPKASDVLYIKALAAPLTVNTMPEGTLKALADHGEIGPMLPADGGDCENVLAQFGKAGIDLDALASQLQDEGAKSFVSSCAVIRHGGVIASKSARPRQRPVRELAMNVKPAHLWAIAFDDTSRAAQVCDKITSLAREKECLVLLDVALAIRFADGAFTLDGEPFLVAKHPPPCTAARFLAGLALGALPLSSAGVGPLLNELGVDSTTVGISDDFVREIARLIKPGTSVLFVLDEQRELDGVLHAIRGLGGTVLKTNVDLERAKLIQSALAAPDRQVVHEV